MYFQGAADKFYNMERLVSLPNCFVTDFHYAPEMRAFWLMSLRAVRMHHSEWPLLAGPDLLLAEFFHVVVVGTPDVLMSS
jgi:hypothetical protein